MQWEAERPCSGLVTSTSNARLACLLWRLSAENPDPQGVRHPDVSPVGGHFLGWAWWTTLLRVTVHQKNIPAAHCIARRDDALPPDELLESEQQASVADLSICLGTSLQISPANNLPIRTVKAGELSHSSLCFRHSHLL
jgi:hypothetical protein